MRLFIKKVNKLLGEVLLERGVITNSQLEEALKVQKQRKELLGEIIVSLGFANEEDIVYALSLQYAFPYLPLECYNISPEILNIVPYDLADKYCFIPIDKIKDALTVVMANPLDCEAVKAIEKATSYSVQFFISTPSDIRQAIARFYPPGK